MADPFTLAMVAAGTSAVVGASGHLAVGKQQQVAHNYNADINERNAKAADQQAEQVVFAEELEIVKFRNEFEELQAATNQAQRYNGWIAEGGTPLKVALQNAIEADEEVETRRYNAKVGAQQLREGGVQERMQATLNRMYGRAARSAGRYKAMGSILGGVQQGATISMLA